MRVPETQTLEASYCPQAHKKYHSVASCLHTINQALRKEPAVRDKNSASSPADLMQRMPAPSSIAHALRTLAHAIAVNDYKSVCLTDPKGPEHEQVFVSDLCLRAVRLLKHRDEDVVEAACELIANCSGSTGSNPVTRTWEYGDVKLALRQTRYIDAGVGYQTWPSSTLLARAIIDGVVPPPSSKDFRILEVGAGPGLVSMVAARVWSVKHMEDRVCGISEPSGIAAPIWLTDYQEEVLRNAEANVVQNRLEKVIRVCRLDWRLARGVVTRFTGISSWDTPVAPTRPNTTSLQVSANSKNAGRIATRRLSKVTHKPEGQCNNFAEKSPSSYPVLGNADRNPDRNETMHDINPDLRFGTVLASDVVYDPGHADLLPKVFDQHLSHVAHAFIHMVLPTELYRAGIMEFEERMEQENFCLVLKEKLENSFDGRENSHTRYCFRRRYDTDGIK